jgi:hypothetical protein
LGGGEGHGGISKKMPALKIGGFGHGEFPFYLWLADEEGDGLPRPFRPGSSRL